MKAADMAVRSGKSAAKKSGQGKNASAKAAESKRPQGKGATAKTGAARRSLTQTVTDALRAKIQSGALKPGEKLPTEQALSRQFEVSRTVVREAVAGLRADGLVEPRQGAGVFVLQPPEPVYGLRPALDGPMRISAAIETLELRAAVEIEAAGLAAQRSSPAQQARIRERHNAFGRAVDRGERAAEADYDFHLSIAEATNNPHFRAFLTYLGDSAIPRVQLGRSVDVAPDYLRRIQAEHAEILDAICARDDATAREAMRNHLKGSQERYQRLAEPD